MPKIRIDVNKLENGTADYISLVNRGANRIPFRIIKQHPETETGMINVESRGKLDLSDIRNVIKMDQDDDAVRPSRGAVLVAKDAEPKPEAAAEAPKPTIVGLVVEKGDHMDEDTIKELHAAGVATDNTTENEDNTVIFNQGEGETSVVVKMSGNTLALVADLDAETIVKDTPLAAVFEECGFLPSPEEALSGSVTKADEGKEDEAAAINAGIAVYVQRLKEALPELAFKADEIVTKACKKKKTAAQKLDAPAAAVAKVEETKDCPICDGKGCKACGSTGKVMKEDAARMELLLKAFPPKKPAAPAADAAQPAASEGGMEDAGEGAEAATEGAEGGGGAAPEGVDQDAWDNMTPDEKSTVQAAAQGSTAPAAPAAPAAAPAAAAPAQPAGEPAAPAPAAPGNDAAPKKPNPFAKKAEGSQEADSTATVAPMDATVQKALSEMAANIALITKSVGELVTKVAAVETTAQTAAQKAEAAAKGTVIGAVPAEDHAPAKVTKHEHKELGVIDTAYQTSVRTQKSSFAERQIGQHRTAARR
jgi:hypothetical protein